MPTWTLCPHLSQLIDRHYGVSSSPYKCQKWSYVYLKGYLGLQKAVYALRATLGLVLHFLWGLARVHCYSQTIQCCSWSPDVCSNCEGKGVCLGGSNQCDLEYTDDMILLATSLDNLKLSLQVYDEEADKLGLSVNWLKMKLMCISENAVPASLTINQTVEFVDPFHYLSLLMSNTGNVHPEICWGVSWQLVPWIPCGNPCGLMHPSV